MRYETGQVIAGGQPGSVQSTGSGEAALGRFWVISRPPTHICTETSVDVEVVVLTTSGFYGWCVHGICGNHHPCWRNPLLHRLGVRITNGGGSTTNGGPGGSNFSGPTLRRK